MFQIKVIVIKFITAMMFFVYQVSATNTAYSYIDEQRPDDISDKKWSSLKTAIQDAKLLPTPNNIGGQDTQYGESLSIDGNRALIGSRFLLKHGGAFVLDYDGSNWIETAVLVPDDGSVFDQFGSSVSLSGDKALIGSESDDDNGSNSGSVYIFDLVASTWEQTVKLTPGDGASNDKFGSSVSLLGDRILVGATQDDDNGIDSGSAYVFDLSGGIWGETIKLTASNGTASDKFGSSVSLSGNRALIGAKAGNGAVANSGSAYVFDLTAGIWGESTILSATSGGSGDNFGFSVSLSGDRALIGAYHDDDNGFSSGSAFIFDLVAGNWGQTTILIANDASGSDQFGHSVSLLGDRALIGAFENDDIANNSGSAYIFETSAGTWGQTKKLTANDATAADFFGYSVSLTSDRALIGAYNDDENGLNSGSAYVYDLNGATWMQTEKISSIGATRDQFGFSVDLSGDRALIGAYQDDDNGSNSGSAYIFELTGGNWVLMDKITSSDGEAGDFFGYSVSLFADRAIIGAYKNDDTGNESGAVYVFELNAGSWVETNKLISNDGADEFGYSVSLLGDQALIGAQLTDGITANSGAAYIFDFSAGTWFQTIKLTANDGIAFDMFGNSVSLSINRALIGAFSDDDNGSNSGSAYIFDFNGSTWSQTTKLTDTNGSAHDEFGNSVSLSGDRVLIGSHVDDNNGGNSGSAFIFELSGGSWSQTAFLLSSDGTNGDQFGYSVSLSGDRAVIGAHRDDDNGNSTGSVYVFELSGGTWSETDKLTANDPFPSDSFGSALSLSGDRMLIGADGVNDRGFDSGAAYVLNVVDAFEIFVTVTGLDSGNSIEVTTNGQNLNFTGDGGPINFNNPFSDGTIYAVAITVQPTSPNQTCTIEGGNGGLNNGSGTIVGVDVNIAVECSINQYFIGGTTTGLISGNPIELELGSETLNVDNNSFIFTNPLDDETNYTVVINNEPTSPSQSCSISNQTGTITGGSVMDVEVDCMINQYTIGGNVTGLFEGNEITIQNNSTNDISITNNGSFTFSNALDDLLGYEVIIQSPAIDPIQPCVITNASGFLSGANITNVSINCDVGTDLIFKDDFE